MSLQRAWRTPPAEFRLSADEVHVWRVPLDLSGRQLDRLWRTLTADERRRAERFVFRRHRRRYVAARGLLRAIVGRYLNLEPRRLRFEYNQYGKPSLATGLLQEPLSFNVSHSDEMALYALNLGRSIGVDLERIRRGFPVQQVAERFFADQEAAALRALPDRNKPEAFFACWTRKEAYIKARGEGLSHPLDAFAVSLIPGESTVLVGPPEDGGQVDRWSIEDLQPGPAYAGALAIEGAGWQLSKFSGAAAQLIWPSHREQVMQ